MDMMPIDDTDETPMSLSYDDTVPYAEQVPVQPESASSSLANRIGQTKVYLISDATATRSGKVRWQA